MEKRFFTLEEARQLLPELKEWAGELVQLSGQLENFRDEVQALADSSANNTGGPDGTAYLEILVSLQTSLGKIQDSGCLVKSLSEGLVDFPHMKDGREVYLCWKYGEDDIQYWHEVDSGYEGRIPLLE